MHEFFLLSFSQVNSEIQTVWSTDNTDRCQSGNYMLIYISMQLNTYNIQQKHEISNSQILLKKRLPILYFSTLIVWHFFSSFTAKDLLQVVQHIHRDLLDPTFLVPLALPLLPRSTTPQKSKGPLPGWSSGRQLGLVCCVLGAEKGLCHPGPGSGCYGSWPDTGKTLQVWNWAEVHSGRAGWALRWKSFRAVSDSLGEAEMTCIIYWE